MVSFVQSNRIFLTLQAGGQAVDSHMNRMLEVVPQHIHDRSGIFLGSYDEVQKVIDIHKKTKTTL
jgi:fructose-1,6-bisphosphatase